MLKILKYDWKNGWNSVKLTLLGAMILSIVFGICLGFMGGQVVVNSENIGVIGGQVVVNAENIGVISEKSMDTICIVLSIVWFSVMTALLVLTVIAIFQNMSSRMFGPEGYLTHALPVDRWELLGGKVLGTWLFGVFMVCAAVCSVLLIMASTAASSIELSKFIAIVVDFLPKLGSYHFQQIATGLGYMLYGIGAFLAWSLLLVVQFQFICVAARQFGKFHTAGGVIVFVALLALQGNINKLLSMGFVVVLLCSIACFCGSNWLLKHRLNVG